MDCNRATWPTTAPWYGPGLPRGQDGGEWATTESFADARRLPDLPVGEPTDFAGKMALTGLPSDQEIFYRVTADVHYTAAHRYSPERATFQHFDPFWEVVSGPLHAEAFGSSEYDPTFGPEVVFAKHPTEEQGLNRPSSMGLQFFGKVDISAATRVMTVSLMDSADTVLWATEIEPAVG